MVFSSAIPETERITDGGRSELEGRVAICMATYNGGRFVSQQIDSILRQTYSDWVLFVRDDGSTDDTCAVVDSYVSEYPNKIIRINDTDELHDCSLNFLAALRFSFRDPSFDFFMFCDQDDVWNNDKVELEVAEARRLQNWNSEEPVLVITNCAIVDGSLRETGMTLGERRVFDPRGITLAQSLANNVGQGATMLMSRSLAKEVLSNPLDRTVWMYDWWVMMLALCLGRVAYISEPTMKYRQHEANVVGAGNYHRGFADGLGHILKEPSILKGWVERLVSDERAYTTRAQSLLAQLGSRLSCSDFDVVERVARLNNNGVLARLRTISDLHLWRQNTSYEKMYQFWSIVLAKRASE